MNSSFLQVGEESWTSLFEVFEPLSDSDIKQLLRRPSNVFWEHDPMPTWLDKCQAEQTTVIRNFVNISPKNEFSNNVKVAMLIRQQHSIKLQTSFEFIVFLYKISCFSGEQIFDS